VHFQVYALGVSTWLLSRLNTYQLAHRYTVFGYDNGVALLNQRKQPTEASASLAASHDGKHWHCTSVLLALSGGLNFCPTWLSTGNSGNRENQVGSKRGSRERSSGLR